MSTFRSALYRLARVLGDIEAAKKGSAPSIAAGRVLASLPMDRTPRPAS